jgi:spermidine synthase
VSDDDEISFELGAGGASVTGKPIGTAAGGTSGRMTLKLLLVSVLALYLELLLIRWIGTEIRIFAYLQNTVLVVCFFGLGIGLFTANRPVDYWRGARALLLIATLLLIPVTRDALMTISQTLSVLGQLNIWYQADFGGTLRNGLAALAGLIGTLALMMLIIEPFVPLGRVLGRLMDGHPRTIVAYSVNVFGSLVGIWLFVFLSSQLAAPPVWFGVLFLLYLPFLLERGRGWLPSLLAILAIVPVAWFSRMPEGAVRTVWSPYQKLTVYDRQVYMPVADVPGIYLITVNNVGYQEIIDFSDEGARETPAVGEHPYLGFSPYDIPFLFHPKPKNVLLVGAGSGNDAAGALRHGAIRITAVEIDPVILEMGREFHPEEPYAAENVRVVTDDARSFFATTPETYDVIVFGLLDSHTTTAMTNARLDHYVYTRESILQAKRLLEPGGIIFLSFEAKKLFIGDRIAVILRDVFEEEPIAFRMPATEVGRGGVMFVAGDLETARSSLADQDRLANLIATWNEKLPLDLTYSTKATTDDWPYLYLERPRIPILFVLLAGLMAVLVLHARRAFELPAVMNPTRWRREAWHFAFLGAGFLLLEVQNISKAAVVLGNTWVVNAIVISGILAMVLLANLLVSRRPHIPLGPVYGALIASTLALFFVDLARFAFMPFPVKAAVVGLLTSVPILFSGIAFMKAFARVEHKDLALGANLLGALVGGMLQSLSFLVGVKALLLFVALFYALAFRTRYRQPAEVPESAVPDGESVAFE